MDTARNQLLLAGERLIATEGLSVSLRDIAVAAGQRNNSAVHYHFGSREGLVDAIVTERQVPLENRRMELIAAGDGEPGRDIPELASILVGPMFEIPYLDGSNHYARFLHHIRFEHKVSFRYMQDRGWFATKLLCQELYRKLDHLTEDERRHRLRSMMTITFSLLADLERDRESEPNLPTAARIAREEATIAMVVAAITA